MIGFENSAVQTFTAKDSSDSFRPHQVFSFDKHILKLTSSEEDTPNNIFSSAARSVLTALESAHNERELYALMSDLTRYTGISTSEGFAIFENDKDHRLALSSSGVWPGGWVIVTSKYVVIIYLKTASAMTVCRYNNATINFDFQHATGLNYLSTKTAQILGSKPEYLLPTVNGCFSSFKKGTVPPDGISYEYAVYEHSEPLAYYGIKVGNISTRVRPKSRAAAASYILCRGYQTVEDVDLTSSAVGYARGIVLTPTTRELVRKFKNALEDGGNKFDLTFCNSYVVPDSYAVSCDSALNVAVVKSEEDYNADTTVRVIFIADGDKQRDGYGVSDWINNDTWENAQYLGVNGGAIGEALDKYHRLINELLAKVWYTHALHSYESVQPV